MDSEQRVLRGKYDDDEHVGDDNDDDTDKDGGDDDDDLIINENKAKFCNGVRPSVRPSVRTISLSANGPRANG